MFRTRRHMYIRCLTGRMDVKIRRQLIEDLHLSVRAQSILKENGIDTINKLRDILMGKDGKVSFRKIDRLGEVYKIDIMHKAISKGIITAGELGKYCKNSIDQELWECYRTIMEHYK